MPRICCIYLAGIGYTNRGPISHSYNFPWNTVTSISYLRINHDYHRGRSLGVPNWAAVVQRCCCCGSKRGGAAKPSPYLRTVHPVLNHVRSHAGILNLEVKTKVGVENSETQLLQRDLRDHHRGRSWTAGLPFGCRLWLPAALRQYLIFLYHIHMHISTSYIWKRKGRYEWAIFIKGIKNECYNTK